MVYERRQFVLPESPHDEVLSHCLRMALSRTNPRDSAVVLQCVTPFGVVLNCIKNLSGTGPNGAHRPRTSYCPHFKEPILSKGQPLCSSSMP